MFTEVAQERVGRDALNYGPQLNAASMQLITGERDAWYDLLPSELKDQPPSDPRESLAKFFYDEADRTAATARDADLGRDNRHLDPRLEAMAARQYMRVHARTAISRLVRAAVQTDVPFYNDQNAVTPEAIDPILDQDEGTPERHHSLIIDSALAARLFEQPHDLASLVNKWFYDSRLGVYVQVTPPNPTDYARKTLRQATGSDAGVEAALAGKVQLNAFMGAAAVRNYSFTRNA